MTNKKIKNIIHKEELYASVFNLEEIAEGLDFLTNDESFIQVGTWKYEKGKVLDAHYHNTYERKAYLTQEVVIVLNGTILCNLFTLERDFITTVEVKEKQLIIQYQGIQEYEIIEDSKIIEVKNGPYFGPDKDRTRVDVKKD